MIESCNKRFGETLVNIMVRRILVVLVFACGNVSQAFSATLRVAVASNFASTAEQLEEIFERDGLYEIEIIRGATGKLSAQIMQGAPYDVFLSADAQRPKQLELAGAALKGTRFTYALGKIVVWRPESDVIIGPEVFSEVSFDTLSIANTRIAPYGLAAQQALRALGYWDAFSSKIIQGENVSYAFHQVATGNADIGIVAYSQVKSYLETDETDYWVVPQNLYEPIEQQAIQLTDRLIAEKFLSFLNSYEARSVIEEAGYGLP